MGRALRSAEGGYAYHVLNRANGRLPLFDQDGDYRAFERVLAEAREHHPIRILAYCVMPNHWHLVLWPERDGQLSRFVCWLTLTHTQRWHAHRHSAGTGHLYQGRFRSFPVQSDEHLLTVCRYVERNPLRAGLVKKAEAWPWGSLGRRHQGDGEAKQFLSDGPVPYPATWLKEVNRPQTEAELEALRQCARRGRPFGDEDWVRSTAARLHLETTLRPRGRPKKARTP